MISALLVRRFVCLGSDGQGAKHGIAFLTPANAMLSVELTHLADILDSAKQAQNVSSLARTWSARISNAIWNTTVSCRMLVNKFRTGRVADEVWK
jgi:hypothetical protein